MKKRILYFYFNTQVMGGAEKSLYLLIKEMRKSHDLEFFAVFPRDGIVPQKMAELGVKVKLIDFKTGIFTINPYFIIRNLVGTLRLFFYAKKHHIQLFHVNDIISGEYLIAALVGRLQRIRVVCHARTLFEGISLGVGKDIFKNQIKGILQFFIKHFIHKVICVSQAVKASLATPQIEDKMVVIYDGIDTTKGNDPMDGLALRENLGLAAEDYVVSIIGRFDRVKGHSVFLESAAKIKERNNKVRFLIIGDDPEFKRNASKLKKEMVEIIDRLGIWDVIIFTGYQEDVYPYLDITDILACPSYLEGLGIIILEAAVMKKPVVGSSAGGIPEIITHGETGYLVPYGDANLLAEKILYLLEHQEVASKFGHASYQFVINNFSIENHCQKMREIYEETWGRQ